MSIDRKLQNVEDCGAGLRLSERYAIFASLSSVPAKLTSNPSSSPIQLRVGFDDARDEVVVNIDNPVALDRVGQSVEHRMQAAVCTQRLQTRGVRWHPGRNRRLRLSSQLFWRGVGVWQSGCRRGAEVLCRSISRRDGVLAPADRLPRVAQRHWREAGSSSGLAPPASDFL